MTRIHPTALIYPSVSMGKYVDIGPFTVVGQPRSVRSFGSVYHEPSMEHWDQPRGCVLENGVTVSVHVVICDGSRICERAFVDAGVYIGHDSQIGPDVELFQRAQVLSRVTIEEEAWIGGFACNDSRIGRRAVVYGKLIHRFVDAIRGIPEEPPHVDEEAFVGEGAIVIGGVVIGKGAYVAAGSVVTCNVPPGRLYLGAPARDVGVAPKPFRTLEGRYLPRRGGDT